MDTVNDLIQEIRDQADEHNKEGPLTDDAILRVLNRGLLIANGILARQYPDPLLKRKEFNPGTPTEIPYDCYGDMVEYIEISVPGGPFETRRRMYRDATRLFSPATTSIPRNWDIEGRAIRWFQAPSGTYPATMWYVRKLDKLVKSSGRITSVGSNYLIVDELTGVTSESDQKNSYINVINGMTGEVKGTFQINAITGQKVTLRSVPIRSEVGYREVTSSDKLSEVNIREGDDYISIVDGSCVPFFRDELLVMLVQYCVAEISRSSGSAKPEYEKELAQYAEKRLASTWAGREQVMRVKNRAPQWRLSFRRLPTQRQG